MRGVSPSSPRGESALPLARLIRHTAVAVQAVRAGQSLNDALARCPEAARPGTQALSFHVLRRLGAALALRRRLVPKPPAAPVDALLITALSLLWPDADAPYTDHTLVDQAVTAARAQHAASAGFVNAVLRRFLRERAALVDAVQQDPEAAWNHPAWWIERLQRDWPDRWQALLHVNNERAPMSLRVNARRSTAADYVARLAAAGVAARVVGAQAVVLAVPCPVTQLPGFADGDVSVQDASAQRAAALLLGVGTFGTSAEPDAKPWLPPGARVLDACAAPGGKTAHLLELADLDALALDSDAARLVRVRDTLARLHLNARTLAGDAGAPGTWWDGLPFDAILLDAPCSASGIVRRHPDVRWLRRASDIAALVHSQARLLDALWPLLKPGGRLLYATCSVFKAEGCDTIDAFLQRHADASPSERPASPGHLLPLADNEGEPNPPHSGAFGDGFFYALLQKHTLP